MDLLWFLVIGAVAGWLAGIVMKTGTGSLGRNLVVGIIGAFLGGWLLPMVGVSFSGLTGALIMATAGAVILLFLLKTLAK